MKKLLVLAICAASLGCNTSKTKEATSDSATKMASTDMASNENVSYPYPINYSSKFEVGDPKNSQMILGLWKDYDNNDFDKGRDHFADTVTMLFSGMNMMNKSRDTMMASTKAYRNTFKSAASKIDAVMSVKATDKNEDWVLVWGTETHTDFKKPYRLCLPA